MSAIDHSPSCPFQSLTLVGLGLIGGSFAMAARAAFPELPVYAVDPASDSLQYALRSGIIDRGVPGLHAVPLDWWEGAEENRPHLIVLGAHLSHNMESLQALGPKVQGQPVWVMDLGSCKRGILETGHQVLPGQFIGGHPMAGKERSGIENATSLLFAGKLFFLVSHPEDDCARFEAMAIFLKALGMRPKWIDAETHDRMMAYVSHLPQLYSIALTNLLFRHDPAQLLSYHGGGIDDQLRLAASPHAMWGDVFSANQDNMRQVIGELIGVLEEMETILDTPELATWFQRSNRMHGIFQEVLAQRFRSLAEGSEPNPTAASGS